MQIIVASANAMPKEGKRELSWYLVVSKWFIFQLMQMYLVGFDLSVEISTDEAEAQYVYLGNIHRFQ